MVRIERNNIEATRGDSIRFTIELSGREIKEGTRALFTVKSTPWEPTRPVIEYLLDVLDSKVHVLLETEDTTWLTSGDYVWDLRILEPREDGGDNVLTPMEYGTFRLLEAIGE